MTLAERMGRARSALIASLLTTAAMIFFAANSVLCRLALGERSIDAYAFTAFRLGSGALTLWLIGALRHGLDHARGGHWRGALWLVLYALPFSLAYLRLDTGTGALLLFGAVQLTMVGAALRSGERPGVLEWIGLAGALGGVAYLVSPGMTAPDPLGALLMSAAGVGWGAYSLAGKGSADPLRVTRGNFGRAAIIVVPATALAWPWLSLSTRGVAWATLSGAVASGVGYAIWYAALRYLSLTRAALVQLAVPAIAALGGVVFVDERIALRLVLASVAILGSIALGVVVRGQRLAPAAEPR
jgi:drug/metabolite transporter (DMT)-like permease